MEFDGVNIILSLIFGTFGLIYFRYGKKQPNIPLVIIGLVLMIYPYFISNRWVMIAIGVVLTILPKFLP